MDAKCKLIYQKCCLKEGQENQETIRQLRRNKEPNRRRGRDVGAQSHTLRAAPCAEGGSQRRMPAGVAQIQLLQGKSGN